MVKKIIIMATSIFILAACTVDSAETTEAAPPKGSMVGGKGNPASVNCIEKGGKITIMKQEDGGEFGMCAFQNGKKCEEWALFRGKCSEK